ncbi:MAG: hypothetical protein HY862_21445 [Chloroflexi bacterium]|nr:hypothetical protein [Chloroflexota bacterium]
MKKWIYLGIVIGIITWPLSPIKAQDGTIPPLTQQIALQSDVGRMTMDFPFGWRSGNPLEVDATYIEVDNGSETVSPTIAIEAIIAPYNSLPFTFNTRAENPAEAYFEAFRTQRFENRYGVYGEIVPALFGPSLNPYSGAMMMLLEKSGSSQYLTDGRIISIGVGIAIAENTLLIISFQSSVEDFEGWRNTWLAMLDTLKWNDVPLMNTTNRQRTANLEDSATMVGLYNSAFPEVDDSNISTLAVPITIITTMHSLTFFPPNQWQHTLDDGIATPIMLSPINSNTAFAAIRWVPAGTAYGGLVIQDENLNTDQWLLSIALVQEIRVRLGGGVTKITSFKWNGYPAAAVAYQFTSSVPNIRYLIAVPNDGFIEITLQALPTEWVQIGIDFDYILSSLTLDDVLLDSEAAREARQELSVQ